MPESDQSSGLLRDGVVEGGSDSSQSILLSWLNLARMATQPLGIGNTG
jgi:hypothetical protein